MSVYESNLSNSTFFLSLFDPRQRPKGSRDPLGTEAVWGKLGRRLVGNLTTVTSNLESFFVALLCCDYSHQVISGNDSKVSAVDIAERQERFARMEQVLAYIRLSFPKHAAVQGILGITKAKARLEQKSIKLGLAHPLLTNQLSMGLWGYYTPAMARAGLVNIESRKLTEQGGMAADSVKSELGTAYKALCEYADAGQLDTDDLIPLAEVVEQVFYQLKVRKAFVEALIEKNADCSAQAALYQQALLYIQQRYKEKKPLGAKHFLDYLADCESTELNIPAQDIKLVEPVLVINSHVFNWLQGQHDRTKDEVVKDLQERMSVTELSVPPLSLPRQSFWQRSAELINQCDIQSNEQESSLAYVETYLEHLLEHHKEVTKARHGAPWVELRNDKVFVRVVSSSGKLPAVESGFSELTDKLENSYFLYSFLAIAKEAIDKESGIIESDASYEKTDKDAAR
ncbi:hypothetical protein [uncultured Shewanella sp.]|uniref:hypothetical protein n=1 Tax=uncultured Shewanella sp. TaxID=173975 RepID=UPI0026196C9D|nr:hypothetical protein [uncultured Shewanella sp.]